ncbi:LptF/LptG family permease [Winogradskyella immobilis]|uniref:LptF/LptG family permease n=1 Tax=Winogradskyella immobilis TaxID=2816852 RepID=A0ABS8ELZ5_9FLAO|nr:LptF/LptG family permease [Winogradskyella immobilis]MCC1484234.1 LptF/LptG family permease [Winogradskyella immobilis]MCG0016326.1 LptF/LptG family permease [Winogradskyella immobilis]
MKILDRYILVTYLRTFLSVFVIFMFIFVLQGFWLYISDLAGKDLDMVTTMKFIGFYSPKLIPLVVPLTVLLSSIMVFGSFAENYEFAAMKSTGISLQRAMRSLSIFIIALGFGCFLFSNNVIPWGEYNFYNLRRNIAKVKPALAIAEGQFNEIGDINIWVEEKSGDRGQFLKDVKIHKKKSSASGNYTIIVSETGELLSSTDSNILQLKLNNGNYYDELINRKDRNNVRKKPHAQSTFVDYIVNIDLANLNNVDLNEKKSDNRFSMLDVNELSYTIDSLNKEREKKFSDLSTTLYNRSTFDALRVGIEPRKDTLFNGNVMDLFENNQKIQILNLALNTANSSNGIITTNETSIQGRTVWRNRHIIALHEKYVLGIACIILFFVGAPLGALIRKGGLGLPMVLGVLLFLTYHFIGLFAINSAKDGTLNPVLGTWLSTLIMLPLSIYLTSRATKDRGLVELDVILVPLKKLFRSKSELNDIRSVQSYSYYNKHSIDELITVVKNHNDYDIDKKPKQIALQHLFDRNKTLEELNTKGLDVPNYLHKAKNILKDYIDYSTTSLVTYSIGTVLLVLHFVFNNNKLPELAITVKSLSFIAFGIYILYVIVSSIFYSRFYKTIGLSKKRINPILIIFSLPFYPIKYFIFKAKTKEDFHLSCLENIK